MTGQERDHAAFDELAAGHVLHALSEEDEQRFLRHAEDCPQCPEILAGFWEVAAALAETSPAAGPAPDLGERIMAVVRADLAGDGRAGASALAGQPEPIAGAAEPGPDAGGGQPGAPESSGQPGAPEDGRQPGAPKSSGRSGGRGAGAGGSGAAAEAGTAEAPPGQVIPLARRPVRRWLRPVAAAAAAVVIGGGIWAGLAATSSSPPSFPSSCAHQRGCAEVAVLSPTTHQQAARVVVLNGSVYLTPARMPADNRASQIYVLWQIPKGQAPLAVGSFDVRPGPNPALKIGSLVAPYGRTAAFAISLEPGRKVPPAPSKVIAAGLIT